VSKFIAVYGVYGGEVSKDPSYVNFDLVRSFKVQGEYNEKPYLEIDYIEEYGTRGVVSQEDFAKLLKGGNRE
jgi:hypothetical protein